MKFKLLLVILLASSFSYADSMDNYLLGHWYTEAVIGFKGK